MEETKGTATNVETSTEEKTKKNKPNRIFLPC